ncbi:unnamed protein product [Scytosiphon promiscuus]
MSAASAHPFGHRDYLGHPTEVLGFAHKLGLDGMPTRSLVEFEGGGSMLSREVLGEMLATNQRGILNARGGVGRESRSRAASGARRKTDGTNNTGKMEQGNGGGADKEGGQLRFLCQADALRWLRESSSTSPARARMRCPSKDARGSKWVHGNTTRECGGGQGRRPDEHVLLPVSDPEKHFAIYGGSACTVDKQAATMSSAAFETSRAPGSPDKRRRRKLYDHDHNPRVLRTLVDDTVITGIAGGGSLEAEEGRQMEELRLQLRLACDRATELEDLIFQSQTGAPHRELLGELHLDRAEEFGDPLPGQPNWNSMYVDPEMDGFKRCRTPDNAGGCRSKLQKCRMSPRKKRREPLDVSFSTPKSSETQRFQGNSGNGATATPRNPPAQRAKTPYEVMSTCCPPLSPPLTPTGSLRRYLSSLRPFSAGSSRAAWGLADPADSADNLGSGRDHGRVHGDSAGSFDGAQPRWPVLFVMGSSKPPPPRHPLGVHALPLFDDSMVALLAEAAGEPAAKVRAMVQVLTRFDFGLLQAAVRRLLHSQPGDGAGAPPATKSVGRKQRKGAPGPAMQAWGKHAAEALPFSESATAGVDPYESSSEVKRQAQSDDGPLIVSDAAAGRALVGGFLSGVFGERAVRDIVVASRPVVVFDSTGSVEGDGAADRCEDGILLPTKVDDGAGEDSLSRRRPGGADSTACREDEPFSLLGAGPREAAPLSEAKTTYPDRNFTKSDASRTCVEGNLLVENTTQRMTREMRAAGVSRTCARGGEGVLVAQLVRATAARFRVHSLAVRHREVGDLLDQTTNSASSHLSTLSCSRGGDFGRGIFIGGSGGSGWTVEDGGRERNLRRPASADSDELGLPPLKLVRRDKAGWRKRVAGERRREKHREDGVEMEVDVFGASRPRSTPRCLRPGYKGEITAAMLRQELEVSESTAARLGITMARKAEAWKLEAQQGGGFTADVAATAAANRAALALASTRARDALLEAARERMLEAVNLMYVGIIRRSWKAWTELVRRQRSLDTAGRVARLAGAAALGFGVIEPLLRRRTRAWLRRWAGAMRAERVLEVQAAAVELQRAARGFLGRVRARQRRRGRAALAVQKQKYREFMWQRDAVKLLALKKRHRAATKVQAAWRSEVYGRRPAGRLRRLRREGVATVMLQRLWRGVVARGKADVLLEAKLRREAAVRIQAAARGRGARNVYRPMILRERAAATMSRFWRCARARRLARRKRSSNVLAARLNPLVRGFLGRRVTRKLLEEHRRKNRAMLLVCVASQKLFRGKQGRLKARRELLRRCAAVEVGSYRAIRRLSQIEEGRAKSLASSWMAAVAVQRIWRGLKGQRKLGQRAAEKRMWDAAFTIQSAYRRMHATEREAEIFERAPATGGPGDGRHPARVGAGAAPLNASDTRNTTAVDTHRSGAGSSTGEGVTAVAPNDDGGELTANAPVPEFGDIGDVALAAVQSAMQPMPPPLALPIQPPLAAPAALALERPTPVVPPVVRVAPLPAPEETLEYYQAKLRSACPTILEMLATCRKHTGMFRAFAARRRLIPLRAERDKRERRLAEELGAALVLQSASRTRAARLAVARRRAEILEAARREQGLLTIQCAVRCFLGKCRLQALVDAEKAKQDKRYRMAARIQARVRGIQTRDVWRKFFNSRALLQRERQRKGAQQIQSYWRSKLARTEAERRRSARDVALLAEELERHLKGLLESTMEAERRHAYAVRIQCWWRGILAVKLKIRRRLLLKEVPLEDVEQESEKAALVLQCHWRAIKARRSYNANYARLYRERERRKCCTECQSQYATRQCDTCLDKFCEGCWARIHSTGARRFHDWRPFAPASYDAFHPSQDTDAAGYTIPSASTTVTTSADSSGSGYYNQTGPWAADPQFSSETAAAALTAYDGFAGYESYDYHASSEYYYGSQGGADQQQQGNWSAETNQQLWYDPSHYGGGDYYQDDGGGWAESYDGAAAASAVHPAWASVTPPTTGSADGSYDQGDQGATTGWEEGWATPEAAEIDSSTLSGTEAAPSTTGFATTPGNGEGNTTETPPSGSGGSSSRPWSVNEFGQRVAGDWVEYWDDAAQAAYFYNTATGEARASWTEPATG